MKRTFLMAICILVLVFSQVYAGGVQDTDAATEKDWEIVYVAKIIGLPWFNLTEQGLKDYAEKIGGLNASLVGPVDADPAQQYQIVADLVAKRVDAICVAPNDGETLEPILKKAMEEGILVITHESPNQVNTDWDIEMVNNTAFGEEHTKKLVDYMGDEGGYAVYVGGLTVPTHNAWADAAVAYQEKNYPGLYQLTDRIPCAESIEESYSKTLELIKAYPDLKGILAFGSQGPIGAAQAVREKGLKDKIAVVGVALPSQAVPYLEDGSMKHGFLYDPYNVGVAFAYLAKIALEGGDLTSVKEIPEVGGITFEDKIIIVDGTLSFTAENAAGLGF